jgi:hypothetical protein
MEFGESLRFQNNILSPSSGCKSKLCKKPAEVGDNLREIWMKNPA